MTGMESPLGAPPQTTINQLVQLFQQGRLNELELLAKQVSKAFPKHGLAWMLLGHVFKNSGRLSEALIAQQKAIIALPGKAELYNNLGSIYLKLGQTKQAEEAYKIALTLQPSHIDAHFNLGLLYKNSTRLNEAEIEFRAVIQYSPDDAQAYFNLGVVLSTAGKLLDATNMLQRALALQPVNPDAYDTLGHAYLLMGRQQEAETCCMKAIEQSNNSIAYIGNLIYILNYIPHREAAQFDWAKQFGDLLTAAVKNVSLHGWQYDESPAKLRVGFVSGDFKNHPVGYFLLSLLKQAGNGMAEYYGYSTLGYEDETNQNIKACLKAYKIIEKMPDADVANLIRDDGIHVLVDLAGHTGYNRLEIFAYKPAPIQITWLGYFSTTGLSQIDYILTDPVSTQDRDQGSFTEKIWYLPHTRVCYTPPALEIGVSATPALKNHFITFGSFQNLGKVNDEVLQAWNHLLQAKEDASLRWQCDQFADPSLLEVTRQRLIGFGLPQDRIRLLGPVDRAAYYAAHAEVDLILDTFPFPGGTTTCDAFWMGVPTLTLAGDSLLSRQGASLLSVVGLSEWVAQDVETYIRKALDFSANIDQLNTLRQTLRPQLLASNLCNTGGFKNDFEQALWNMWHQFRNQASVGLH